MYFKVSFIGVLMLLSTICAIAQYSESNPAFTPIAFPASPNAAALGKFGNYDVSYFSGLPEISIPVYEVQAGSIKVPVTLGYHASGNKVTEVASWVGLGWALNAGGQITRKVMGAKPDEYGYEVVLSPSLNMDDPVDQDSLDVLSNNDFDTEPDIFTYSVPGKSGSFFFNPANSYQPALIPYAPLSIKYTKIGYGLHFIITDETGNRYFYGSTPEVTENVHSGNPSDATTAWMLDTIISADRKDTVTFKYTSQYAQTYFDLPELLTVDDQLTIVSAYPETYFAGHTNYSFSSDEIYTTQQYIQEIDYKNGKVVFDLSASGREDISAFKNLADIKIYNYDINSAQYHLMKTVLPFQSYFEQGTDASSKRLRFDSLQIQDATGVGVEKYRFNYNPLMLPSPLSKARDFWGYYNGKANTSLIPDTTISYFGGDNNPGPPSNLAIGTTVTHGRYPDTAYNQACMLSRIYYPTGGHTDFTYETNRYTSPFSGNDSLSGGLRIKKIASYDSVTSTPTIKTYQYNASRANYILKNNYFMTIQHYEWYQCEDPSSSPPKHAGTETKNVRSFFSSPNIDIIPFDAAPVVYPVVTEYEGDATNNVGKTVYRFTDFPNLLDAASAVRPVINSYAFKRGQLLEKAVYRNNGSGLYQPLTKEQHAHTAFPQTIYSNVGFIVRLSTILQGPCNVYNGTFYRYGDWTYSNYAITSDDNYPTAKTSFVYDQNDSTKYVTQTTTYEYGNITHQQVTKTTSFNSKGDTIIGVKKYPADYLPTGYTATGNAVIDSMLVHNVQAVPIEQWDSIKAVTGPSGVKDGQITIFKQLSPGIFKPDNSKQLEITGPVTNFTPSSISSGQLHFDSRYGTLVTLTSYDGNSNIQEYKARNAMPVSVIWDYGGQLPVAKVTASTNQNIAYTSFEADGKGNWVFSGTSTNDVSAPTGKWAYNLTGGSIKKTGLTSSVTYIISYWSKIGEPYTVSHSSSYKEGKTINGWTYYEHTVTGVTGDTISGGNLIDELRLYPATAQMTTFTYDPMIGMTSQCDINNRITYYQYDDYQRLKLVLDQDKNVIKKICYNYTGQTACENIVYYSDAKSQSFNRNNCGVGHTGSAVTYSVAANTYSAMSKSAANTLAQNDINTNGQSYANAHGTCPADATITCNNLTGFSGFTASYYNVSSGVTTPFTITTSTGTLGTLPQGTYNITIYKPTNTLLLFFNVCSSGGTTGTTSVTFNNIAVSTSACNTVTLDSAF